MPNDNVPQTNYTFYVTYYWDYGLDQIPVAGPPGTPCEVIAVHAPMCRKIVNWVAQAMDGADPQPPDWYTNDNEVLERKAISSTFLTEIADGSSANTIAGVYIYILKIPPADADNLPIGAPPWDSSLNNILFPSAFMNGLLQGATPTGQGEYGGRQSGGGMIRKPFGVD